MEALVAIQGRRIARAVLHLGRRSNHRLHSERARHAHDVFYYFGAVNQNFLLGRFVVGDGLERDVRYDAANLFTVTVLFALVDEAAGWAAASRLEVHTREKSP